MEKAIVHVGGEPFGSRYALQHDVASQPDCCNRRAPRISPVQAVKAGKFEDRYENALVELLNVWSV